MSKSKAITNIAGIPQYYQLPDQSTKPNFSKAGISFNNYALGYSDKLLKQTRISQTILLNVATSSVTFNPPLNNDSYIQQFVFCFSVGTGATTISVTDVEGIKFQLIRPPIAEGYSFNLPLMISIQLKGAFSISQVGLVGGEFINISLLGWYEEKE